EGPCHVVAGEHGPERVVEARRDQRIERDDEEHGQPGDARDEQDVAGQTPSALHLTHKAPSPAPAPASWLWSSRKAYSGRQDSSTLSPCANSRRRPVFCSKTCSSWPQGIRTRYCVLTPTKLTSVTTPPGMVLPGASSASPRAPTSTFSGRIPIQPLSPGACARSAGTETSIPCMSTVTRSPARLLMV